MPEIDGGLAVAEPVEVSTGAETVETGAETQESVQSGSEDVNEVDSSGKKQDLTDKTAAKGKLNLAEVAKKSADALKAINPALPAAIQKATLELGSLYREFPGGLKEAVGLKQQIGEFGGVEGIKETVQAYAEVGAIAQKFFDGKPEFWDDLLAESPASLSAIMPSGLEKWKAKDPEMYGHVQARVLTQTLDGAGVSQTLEQIWNALDGEKQGPLKDAVAKLWQTLDGFRKLGDKAPERKVDPKEEGLTKREQELAQRETRALLAPIANTGRQQIESITAREMAASYQWDKTDASVREAVSERVRSEVVNASKKDKAFVSEFERLKERKDATGLERHIKNFQERVTPGIVQRVAKLFAVKPKGAGPVAVKTTPAANGNGVATQDKGWERIGKQPSFKEIDTAAMGRNYEDMIMSGRAILRGGRKVQWA